MLALGPGGLDIWDSLMKGIVMKEVARFESQTTNLPLVENLKGITLEQLGVTLL